MTNFNSAPLRIAIVGSRFYPAAHGGIETVVENLAKEWVKAGHRVDVYVDRQLATAEKPPHGLSVIEVGAVRTKYSHTISQVASTILKVRRSAYDVVHVHGVGPSFPLFFSRKAFGKAATVVTAHGIDWKRDKWPHLAQRIFHTVCHRSLGRADLLTAVSKSVAAELQDELQCEILEVQNGVSFTSRSERRKDEQYSIFVGRVVPEKNIDGLIRIYSERIADKLGPLVIVGGPGSSYSSRYFDSLHSSAPEWVRFVGALSHSETQYMIDAASRYISLSKLEGQPIAVLEAASLGVPVYLSDIPAHREVVDQHAFFLDLNDTKTLEKQIFENNSLAEELSVAKSAREVCELRTWSTISEKYISEFARLRVVSETNG